MCSTHADSACIGALGETKINFKPGEEVLCKKCKSDKALINLRVRDAYCKECFLNSSIHKFRSTLGKHKVMRHNDHVLIAFNASPSSVALLDLVTCGSENTSQKRMPFSTSVVVIDDTALYENFEVEQQKVFENCKQGVNRLQYPWYLCPLELVLRDNIDSNDIFKIDNQTTEYDLKKENDSLRSELLTTFLGISDESSKEFLLAQLKRSLLIKVAKALNISKVFTAESATSLAVSIMSGIACGRGAQLSLDTGFLDSRNPDVSVIRPMREFNKKEIAMYNHFRQLPDFSQMPTFAVKKDPLHSIEKLSEDFIVGLQQDFPSTIPTVFRTGDKFRMTTETQKRLHEGNSCLFCHGKLDITTDSPNSYQATAFSQLLSREGPGGFNPDSFCSEELKKMKITSGLEAKNCKQMEECNGDSDGRCCSQRVLENELNIEQSWIKDYLCYSCFMVALKSRNLPEALILEAKKRKRRDEMKDSIKDYIL